MIDWIVVMDMMMCSLLNWELMPFCSWWGFATCRPYLHSYLIMAKVVVSFLFYAFPDIVLLWNASFLRWIQSESFIIYSVESWHNRWKRKRAPCGEALLCKTRTGDNRCFCLVTCPAYESLCPSIIRSSFMRHEYLCVICQIERWKDSCINNGPIITNLCWFSFTLCESSLFSSLFMWVRCTTMIFMTSSHPCNVSTWHCLEKFMVMGRICTRWRICFSILSTWGIFIEMKYRDLNKNNQYFILVSLFQTRLLMSYLR